MERVRLYCAFLVYNDHLGASKPSGSYLNLPYYSPIRSAMKLWLILLLVATVLTIALRRVLRRQTPLNDELYANRVAVDHVHGGVAWVRGDGTFGSVNPSFAKIFQSAAADFVGRQWYSIFSAADHNRIRDIYAQMMLMGVIDFEAMGERADRSLAVLRVRLVAVHDSQMRFVGHHCLIEDKTHERELEQRIADWESRRSESVTNVLISAKRARQQEQLSPAALAS